MINPQLNTDRINAISLYQPMSTNYGTIFQDGEYFFMVITLTLKTKFHSLM